MTRYLVLLHVAAGSLAVVGMLLALATKKGGLWHRRGGRMYTAGMAAALVMAMVVSLITANVFLGLIGLFSAYLVYTGFRSAVVKNGQGNGMDRLTATIMLAVSVCMVLYGIYMVISGTGLGVALIVFGIFSTMPAWSDWGRRGSWPKGRERIVFHLSRMGGASIATVTAVFVVNVQTQPEFIAWLLPSLVGTPLIIYWTRRTLQPQAKPV